MGTGRRPGSPEAAWLLTAGARAAPLLVAALWPHPDNAAELMVASVVRCLPERPSPMRTPQRRRKGTLELQGQPESGRGPWMGRSCPPCPAGATCRELWVLGLDRICSEDLQVQGSHRKGTLPRPTDVPDLRIINS